MFHMNQFPIQQGQEISHLCEYWACLDVGGGHVNFERKLVNIQTRKCHDSADVTSYKCGMPKSCIFPKQYDEMMITLRRGICAERII